MFQLKAVEKEEKAFQMRTGPRSAQVSCFYDIPELCGILKTTLPTYIVKSMASIICSRRFNGASLKTPVFRLIPHTRHHSDEVAEFP